MTSVVTETKIDTTRQSMLGIALQSLILVSFVLLFFHNALSNFWTLPYPSDPIEYVRSAVWGTTWGGYWPWLDRLTLAINLRVFAAVFPGRPEAAMYYVAVCNTLILAVAMLWAFRRSGFWAALFVGVFVNSSFMMLGWATYVYPDQTVALFALLAFVALFSDPMGKRRSTLVVLSGVCVGFTILSKITGVAVLIALGLYLLRRRQWSEVVRFLAGVAGGVALVALIFCVLYNVESFRQILDQYYASSIKGNVTSLEEFSHSSSYHETVLSLKYFPLIGLAVAIGAYRNRASRHLFFVSAIFLAFVCVLKFAGPTVPTYIYTAYVFCLLGLSIHLGDMITTDAHGLLDRIPVKLVVAAACLVLLVLGLNAGIKYGSVREFLSGFVYAQPLDIYDTRGDFENRTWVKALYSYAPVGLVALLVFVEYARSRKAAVSFLLLTAFFMALMDGGLAYQKALYDRRGAQAYYDFAPLLNQVPARQFGVYLANHRDLDYPSRVLDVYKSFFNQRCPLVPGYRSQEQFDVCMAKDKIQFVEQKQELANIKGSQILTDDPDAVGEFFPAVKILYWKGVKLSVVETSLGEPALKIDFPRAAGLDVVSLADLDKSIPPLRNGGNRGDFVFKPGAADGNGLRILQAVPEKAAEMQLEFARKSALQVSGGNRLLMSLEVRMPGDSKRTGVFIQDLDGTNWDRSSVTVAPSDSWRTYAVSRRLRPGASELSIGIDWYPSGPRDILEVRNIRIFVR